MACQKGIYYLPQNSYKKLFFQDFKCFSFVRSICISDIYLRFFPPSPHSYSNLSGRETTKSFRCACSSALKIISSVCSFRGSKLIRSVPVNNTGSLKRECNYITRRSGNVVLHRRRDSFDKTFCFWSTSLKIFKVWILFVMSWAGFTTHFVEEVLIRSTSSYAQLYVNMTSS